MLQFTRNRKIFYSSGPGPNVIKPFTVEIYECSEKSRVFPPVKPLQPGLMIVVRPSVFFRKFLNYGHKSFIKLGAGQSVIKILRP
jgi:hypothetical protein